ASCATRRKQLGAADLRRSVAGARVALGKAQLASMITPDTSPTGARHGIPAVDIDCRPSGHSWQAPQAAGRRLHGSRHRPGLLLGRDPRPLQRMGLPEEALAYPP